jgi:hypothetical protein
MCTYGILKLAYEEQDEKRKANLKKTASVSQEHLDVLVKFGRYPHRNAILGRVNTMEETDFLANKKLPLWMRSVSPNKVSDPKDVSKENKTTNVTLTESKNKLKILVLHSNRQSGQMFRSKTEHYLERKLKNIADLTYCDAPKLYEPRGEAESLIKDKEYTNVPNVGFTRAWWNASDDPQTMVYRGLEESLEYINSLFYNSHFDGIIGFSQGGAMTGIISALVSDFHKSDVSYIPIDSISKYLKFVVIISGFYCRDTRPQFFNSIMEELPVKHSPEHVKIRKDPITIPSFHTWGTSDNLVDPWRSEKLSQAFSDKVIHTHPSGHFIKAIKYWPVDEMCKWLGNFVPKESVPLIDYRKVALELFSYGGLNCKYLIKFISDHNKVAVGELITYMVQSGECTGTAIYEILEASNIKLPEIIKEKFSLLTPLIGMCSYPSTEKETKLRSLLVEFISTELVNEYEKYYINKNIGIPSNLATYAPRYNTFHRGTRLFHDIAFKIGSLINIFDVAKSSISEDH